MVQASKRRSFIHSKVKTGCFSESSLINDTKMVVHAARYVCFYHIIMKMVNTSKQTAGIIVNVIQVKIQFVQKVHLSQKRNQEILGRNQSQHDQQRQSQMYVQIMSYVLFCGLFAILVHSSLIFCVIQFIIISTIRFLCSRLKQVRRLSPQRSVAQQVVSCHNLTCLISFKYGDSAASGVSSVPSDCVGSVARAQLTHGGAAHPQRSLRSRITGLHG